MYYAPQDGGENLKSKIRGAGGKCNGNGVGGEPRNGERLKRRVKRVEGSWWWAPEGGLFRHCGVGKSPQRVAERKRRAEPKLFGEERKNW